MKFCKMCNGKGRIPRRDCLGKAMSYYNPDTGDSFPHETCPNCGGTGTIGAKGTND